MHIYLHIVYFVKSSNEHINSNKYTVQLKCYVNMLYMQEKNSPESSTSSWQQKCQF